MQMSNTTKNILLRQRIKVDASKDYALEELCNIQDKIIQFLDRKIDLAQLLARDAESECATNLTELSTRVKNEFTTLGYSGVVAQYSLKYLLTLHSDECYIIAESILSYCRANKLPIADVWYDISANYGIIQTFEDDR
jgi:hypothetical protein